MSITENRNAVVTPTSGPIGLSQIFAVTAGTSNPAYLVLSVLDRSGLYRRISRHDRCTLSGNGNTLRLSSIGGDGWNAPESSSHTSPPVAGSYNENSYG